MQLVAQGDGLHSACGAEAEALPQSLMHSMRLRVQVLLETNTAGNLQLVVQVE